MSARNASVNIHSIFKELKDQPLNDGEDLKKYALKLNAILAQVQGEIDTAASEIKTKMQTMNPRSVEMNRVQLRIFGGLVAGYLAKAADRLESAQKNALKTYSAYEKRFSEDAIEERKQERLRKEAEKERKARLNRKN